MAFFVFIGEYQSLGLHQGSYDRTWYDRYGFLIGDLEAFPVKTEEQSLHFVRSFHVYLICVSHKEQNVLEFVDPHVQLLILGIDFILYVFDLLLDLHFDSSEVVIGNQSGKEFFFGRIALLFQHHLLGVKGFLVFIYDLLASAVYFLNLGDHSIYECRGKFNQFEKVGDLLFQVPDLHVFVGAFDLIAGPVAVIIGFIFLWMMFSGISLSADRAKSEASKYEVKLLATAGIAVMLGHHQLGAFPRFFGDERFMLSGVHQSSPAHLAVVKRIFEYLNHLAVSESLAGVGSKSLFI